MEHPLIPDISDLSLDELSQKITDLTRKISIARNTGNGFLVHQLEMAIETYRNAYQKKTQEQWNNNGGSDFSDKINIE